jgi:hypothetical protein
MNMGVDIQVGEGAVISAGVSRAPFGWDAHLDWGSIPLAAISVETKDSIWKGGARLLWQHPPGTHMGPSGRTAPERGTDKHPRLAHWVE